MQRTFSCRCSSRARHGDAGDAQQIATRQHQLQQGRRVDRVASLSPAPRTTGFVDDDGVGAFVRCPPPGLPCATHQTGRGTFTRNQRHAAKRDDQALHVARTVPVDKPQRDQIDNCCLHGSQIWTRAFFRVLKIRTVGSLPSSNAITWSTAMPVEASVGSCTSVYSTSFSSSARGLSSAPSAASRQRRQITVAFQRSPGAARTFSSAGRRRCCQLRDRSWHAF